MRLNKQEWDSIRQEIRAGKPINQISKDRNVSRVAIYQYAKRNWHKSFIQRVWRAIRNIWVDEEFRR